MKKTVLIVIRVVCIVGFLVCVGVLGWYWHSNRSDRAVAEALAAAHDAASAEAMEQVRAVAADNADTIGWLRIDGTNINNVVMFAPDTPGKYLHMDFYGKCRTAARCMSPKTAMCARRTTSSSTATT